MSKKRGRPKKSEDEKKSKVLPVKMKPDFYDRLEFMAEMAGISKAEILRQGAKNLINNWHQKRQNHWDAKKAENG